MLTAKFDGNYRKKRLPGQTGPSPLMWRYIVEGPEAEVKEYQESDERIVTNDNGDPLFFSRDYHGDSVQLQKAANSGRFFPLGNPMIDKLKSLTEQHGGSIGSALANLAASEILKGIGTQSNTAVKTPETETKPETEDIDKP